MEQVKEKTGTFAIFKGRGAAKFTLMHPRRDDKGYISKNGGILLEAAPAEGKRADGLPNYNWDKKITFGIGVQDITQLVDPATEKLVHKTQSNGKDVTKTLQIQAATDPRYAGTYQLWLNEFSGNSKEGVFVPLSQGEFMILQRLLVASVPNLIGW